MQPKDIILEVIYEAKKSRESYLFLYRKEIIFSFLGKN